jgi:hypothetical protein
LSVGAVVVAAVVVLVVVVDDALELDPDVVAVVEAVVGAVVVVVVVVLGATKGAVSPATVVWLAAGAAERPVQPRAASQLATAVWAAVPVRGWGSPLTSVAGRKTAVTIFRPMAVTNNDPLSVSGGALS